MKKICFSAMLTIAFIFLSACGMGDTKPITNNLAKASQIRIETNNQQGECHFTSNGESLFCNVWNDDDRYTHQSLCKVSMNDFTVENIHEMPRNSYNISCINNMLYLLNPKHEVIPLVLKADLSEVMKLPFSYFVTDGDYYYICDVFFSRGPGIYRVAISDINDDTKNNIEIYTKISDLDARALFLQGQYLYVESTNLTWNGVEVCTDGLWRMDLDGGNPIQIFDSSPRLMLVSEDRLYFADDEKYIYSTDLDGSDRRTLTETFINARYGLTSMNISGSYIFYTYAEGGTLHRVNTDGTNDIQLNNSYSCDIKIVGDWVIYLNDDDHQYYKMHFDGTDHCLINEVPGQE